MKQLLVKSIAWCASFVSLALPLLWIWSVRTYAGVGVILPVLRGIGVESRGGSLGILWSGNKALPQSQVVWLHESGHYEMMRHLGFGLKLSGAGNRVLWVPYWFIMVITAAVAALAWLHMRRGVIRIGTCATCGYDLRATPERCPECGAIPAPVSSSSVPRNI